MAVISNVFTSFPEVVDEVIKANTAFLDLLPWFCLRQGLWQPCFFPLKVSESVQVSFQKYIRIESELDSSYRPRWLEMSSRWDFLRGALDVCLHQIVGWPLEASWPEFWDGHFTGTAFPWPWLSDRCCVSKGKAAWVTKMQYGHMLKIGSFLPKSSGFLKKKKN